MPAPDFVIAYPPELPVSAARDEIARAIRDHQVVIVAGATGSGKTTQLPKICLELGRTAIAHTQPRRIAARTIAERIAEELGAPLGGIVGYRVRFTDRVSADTRIAVMTDGILLNEIHRDRMLRRYDTIIIDEAHERSLNIDFLLGYLKRILPQRPELKLIVTSATIDPHSFARHFTRSTGSGTVQVPVVEVSGRTHPVEIRHRPAGAEGAGDDVDGIVAALRELDAEPAGDVLVFLPGEAEIRDATDAVRGMYASDARPTEVLPLYGRLSAAEQHRVFERSSQAGVRRRVILATNVAETSLTVPGIRYVVDTGTARISRYSSRSKIQRLPIEAISQASAQQRSGRAGRTAPGIAIRLYAEDDFARRDEYTAPEIVRTSLASVVLQMLALGFGDIRSFPFLTAPDSRGVAAAFDLLTELGAVEHRRSDAGPRLTPLGRELARLPIDPRFARMLLQAKRTGVLAPVTAIVAGLSIHDVRERPEAQREAADRLHARFTDPTSDFLTLLNLWNHLQERQHALGSSAFRRLCRAEHLNYVRVREWVDVHRQLQSLLGRQDAGGTVDPDAVHRAILAGLLSHLGLVDERSAPTAKGRAPRQYLGARGTRFELFPGSALRAKRPAAVMAAELVETSRLYARTVAAIDPAWAEPLAGDLAKRQLSDPHWSKDAGAAVAVEKVTLFGVEIVPRRRIPLARIDPVLARELFLRHALVDGDWDPLRLDKRLSAFTRRNADLRRRLERVEERERRRDILSGDEAVLAFYDDRVPREVTDVRSFERWWRDASARTPALLDLTEAQLLAGAGRAGEGDFPGRWQQGDQQLSLAYRFEPGAPDDGVTVVVPLALLARLSPDGFDWQVPGLRDELIAALLRALPKPIRRHVVPAADWAGKLSAELRGQGPESHEGLPAVGLRDALAGRIRAVANQPVTAGDFELDRVPAHLRISFRAVDERGRAAGSDRDLTALQRRLAERSRQAVTDSLQQAARPGPVAGAAEGLLSASKHPEAAQGLLGVPKHPEGALRHAQGPLVQAQAPQGFVERAGLVSWDFDALPETVDVRVPGGVVRGYPALVDEGRSVALRAEVSAQAAATASRAGLRRLLLLSTPSPAGYVLEHLTAAEKLALAASPYPSAAALIEDCRVAVADAVIDRAATCGAVRNRAQFDGVRDAFAAAVVDDLFASVALTARILTRSREVERALKQHTSMALLGPLRDLRAQLADLLPAGFVARTGAAHLAHLPRYLDGMLHRLRGLADDPGRDRARQSEFERAVSVFADAGGTIPPGADAPDAVMRARWLLEEYRISLFAQQLGTAEPVSLQRIQKTLRGAS